MPNKRSTLRVVFIGFLLLLSACYFGNGRICGPQTPMANCDREAYEALMNPKPFLHSWEKENTTPEDRMSDAMEYGGARRERNVPSFSREKIRAEQGSSGGSVFDARGRLFREWERCMLRKDYKYVGECFDNEISKTLPSCGAP